MPTFRISPPTSRRTRPLVAAAAAAALVVLAPPVSAAEAKPRESLLVSTDWLAAHLADPDLVLLHVGDRAGYDAGHLPGARYVSQRDVTASAEGEAGLHLEMLPAEELRTKLAALGVSDGSRIVVYHGKDWVSPSTRILLVLDHAGLGARASLLDGGQPAWVAEGRALSTAVPEPKTGSLAPLTIRSLVVDADFVRSHLGAPGWTIVDARDAEFYRGEHVGGSEEHPHRAGHVAGAKSFAYTNLTDDALHVRDDAELAKRFAAAGVPATDSLVFYCHIGQQATAALFAARLLGRDVRLYDGSFEEWTRLAEAPVDGPPPAPAGTSKEAPKAPGS